MFHGREAPPRALPARGCPGVPERGPENPRGRWRRSAAGGRRHGCAQDGARFGNGLSCAQVGLPRGAPRCAENPHFSAQVRGLAPRRGYCRVLRAPRAAGVGGATPSGAQGRRQATFERTATRIGAEGRLFSSSGRLRTPGAGVATPRGTQGRRQAPFERTVTWIGAQGLLFSSSGGVQA